jgi:hypothetical protein
MKRLAQALLVLLVVVAPASAQGPRSRLLVTVADTTGAVIPAATVRVLGSEDATKVTDPLVGHTAADGVATFAGVVPGRYTLMAEFSGFDVGILRDVPVRPGDNKHVIVLKIQGIQESVTVGQEGQAAAATRAASNFGVALSADQVDSLSDDPDELARQLNDLAGPNAIIRVDSFEGLQLPPKSQIKSVHVTRDQFAAESANPGDTFIDVITQPGVGPIRGGITLTTRSAALSARNAFAPLKGPEQNDRYSLNIGGALLKQRSSFSLNINGSTQYTAPNIYAATPGGATRVETLLIKTPVDQRNVSALADYALTRDQTLRLGFYDNHYNQQNLGVGAYDFPERAYSTRNISHYFRLQEAGPVGRRVFINSRFLIGVFGSSSRSAVEAPTIRVNDAFTSGGAQQRGGSRQAAFELASDVDYIRGMNSWRAGVQIDRWSSRSDAETNYLGTYTFASLDAYNAGQPALYTRTIGDPLVTDSNVQMGAYIQDDVRVSKGLTLSPGVRYSRQTIVSDSKAFEPRFGVTWAPAAGGKTTLRASAGIFHGWLWTGIYEQTLRLNGVRQRDLVIINPSYPDPGAAGVVAPSNKYLLGNVGLQRNVRYSAGIDQTLSRSLRVNVLYNYIDQTQLPRGLNMNAPVDGVRPDPAFANVIATVTDAELRRHELYANVNFNLSPQGQSASGAKFDARRLTAVGSYSLIHARRNADGPFDVPPSGTLSTEWGPGPADMPYRFNVSLNSTQLRNLAVSLSLTASDGTPYTLTTGRDDNQDGIINDRPPGVGLRSLRTTPQWYANVRMAYTLTPGSTPGAPPASVRYKFGLFANVTNLTNHTNLTGFSGVMTSPFFLKPTAATSPRKFDFGTTVSF